MKLHEITKDEGSKIIQFMSSYGLNPSDYFIRPDGIVDIYGKANFQGYVGPNNRKIKGQLPVQFGEVDGDFSVAGNALTTLKGCPTHITGKFVCMRNPLLTSLEFAPKHCGERCNIIGTGITSLVGVHEHIQSMNKDVGAFNADFNFIHTGGLGLIMIEGLVELSALGGKRLPDPFEIIQKYLGRPDDLFECQTELIENGFEEYAKL